MKSPIREFFFWSLLSTWVMVISLGLGILMSSPARAEIRQLEEAPGQSVIQSRQLLQDQHGNRWQAIAFQRSYPNGQTSFDLRLVGFPGIANIDHSQPLMLTNSLGANLTAHANDQEIFTDKTHPEPNVGQYDLQAVFPQVQAEIPLKLSIPTLQDESVRLSVSPLIIQEWKAVASSEWQIRK